MGDAGKWRERERARELRAQSWTLQRIADELGVAKGSVSVWVRDVDHVPNPQNRGHPAGPKHPMRVRKEEALARCTDEAESFAADLTDRDLMMFALALDAGEGAKRDGSVVFANTDPTLVRILLRWLRSGFELDERKLRLRLNLHHGLDLDAACVYCSENTGIPMSQFTKPYRAVADGTIRSNRHMYGCVGVILHSRSAHRRVMASIGAISCRLSNPG
jgi:transcriptional regulator with XRE-family HTH domain